MKIKEKIITETNFSITKTEKESLDALARYCENRCDCSECQFKDMCEGAYLTLAGRIDYFLDIVKIEG